MFLTLTTADVVCLVEIRERWRNLRHWLLRTLGKDVQYVMNYELHPGYLEKSIRLRTGEEFIIHGSGVSHGWHIHAVFSDFIPLRKHLRKIQSFGFGRIDVRRVSREGISDYLTKHALKAYRGLTRKERAQYPNMRLRLVNSSRGLPSLDSYLWKSSHLDESRRIFREWHSDVKSGLRDGDEIPYFLLRSHLARSNVLAVAGLRHDYDFARLLSRAQSLRGGS